MIRDLSETLKAILDDDSLPEPLHSAAIAFERPTDPYSPGQRTVNVFLYDIRENVELRSNEPRVERQNGQTVVHRPPLRVACSYLVTAWPFGGEELSLQEHELLSQVLQDFYNRINGNGSRQLHVVCPHCQQGFAVEPERLGES